MTKPEMIARIQELNRSADAGFLTRFNEPALAAYLGRLDRLHGRRGPASVWVRRQPRYQTSPPRRVTAVGPAPRAAA